MASQRLYAPALTYGLALVKVPLLAVFDAHERLIVRPAELEGALVVAGGELSNLRLDNPSIDLRCFQLSNCPTGDCTMYSSRSW